MIAAMTVAIAVAKLPMQPHFSKEFELPLIYPPQFILAWTRLRYFTTNPLQNQSLKLQVFGMAEKISDVHLFHNPHRFNAYSAHPHQQINHTLFIIRKPIGIELFDNCGVFRFLLFVAFENPLQRGVGAETIFTRLGRDAA